MNGTATTYLQDKAAPLPVVLSETIGGATSRYVYGLDLLERTDPAGTPAFYHADGLGSTRALSDGSGQRTDAYNYDAFGAVRSHTGGSAQPFTFAGEQQDGENSAFYLRSRYYDYSLGRFLQQDTIQGSVQHPQTWHRYAYVFNNPVGLIDPMGFWGVSRRNNLGVTGAVVGGADISGGVGPELEFPSWNPLDWRVGFGVSGGGQVSTGAHAEGSVYVGVSDYIWERMELIPGASDAPVTVCGGGAGSIAAAGGLGVSGSACTGQGKTGVKRSLSVLGGAGGGVRGFVYSGTGTSWTWSLREVWNTMVEIYNSFAGGGGEKGDVLGANDQQRFYYWGAPPSKWK